MRGGKGVKDREGKARDGIPFRDRIGRMLGIPSDAVGLGNGFMAELRGRSGVTVRGCRRILTYSREEIRLDTRDGAVTVAGTGLTCTMYCADAIGIEGRIDGVYFDDRRDALLGGLGVLPRKEDAE